VEHNYCTDSVDSSWIYENSDTIKTRLDEDITKNIHDKKVFTGS